MIGDIVGGPLVAAACSYVLTLTYDELVGAMREERFSKKHLEEMLNVAAYIKREQETFRSEFNEAFSAYYGDKQNKIDSAYNGLIESIRDNNIDNFLTAVNRMGRAFGIEYTLGSFVEIDDNMKNSEYVWQF